MVRCAPAAGGLQLPMPLSCPPDEHDEEEDTSYLLRQSLNSLAEDLAGERLCCPDQNGFETFRGQDDSLDRLCNLDSNLNYSLHHKEQPQVATKATLVTQAL